MVVVRLIQACNQFTKACNHCTKLQNDAVICLSWCCVQLIAGLAPGEAEALTKLDPKWQVNGKFGVVQYAQPQA